MKISCKSPDIAFVSKSPWKHRQGLGNETVRWNVACIQMSSVTLSLSRSLSLSFPLCRLLPPSHTLESSSSKVICAAPGWHISARRAVKFFNQDFPTVFQNPIKYKSIFPEIIPLFVWRHSTLHSVPLSYHCQPFTLTDNHPICTAFYMVTDLTPDQHLFNHLHIRVRVRIHFSAAHPTCGIRSVKWLVRWMPRVFVSGLRKCSLGLSMSQ